MTAWEHKTTVRMYHTDSAGVIFFADLFVLAHDCYESWLEQYISLSEMLQKDIQIPIVHTEADYRLPIRLSEQITVKMTMANKHRTSFTMQYAFINANGEQAAQAKIVHVVIDSQTHQPIEIPSFLQDAFATL